MSVRFGFWLALLFLMGQPLSAIKVPPGLDSCSTLEACLRVLDRVVPAYDNGEGSNADILADKLRRFGNSAKYELLKRASGDHPGWRNVAGAILSEWRSWTPSDVPQLQEALRKQSGGWVARPLGEIGTSEAIEALIADLPNGSENQTDFALSKLGAKAIPHLFAVLESDADADSAARVIREMGIVAVPFAPGWAALAVDPKQPLKVRLGAMRGIAAIGDRAKSSCEGLHGLLSAPEPQIRKQVEITLKAVRDPFVVEEVARSCRPSAPPFDPLAITAFVCLHEVASYGDGGRQAGGELLPFMTSENGAERSYAITTLGSIGYETAIPEIERAINSEDWRVVYAAIRSLGWLGAKSAIPDIERIGSEHWLPEVRAKARQITAALSSPKGRLIRPSGFGYAQSDAEPFAIGREVLDETPHCPSNRWQWKTISFPMPERPDNESKQLHILEGKLVGTNRGEWGGQLIWQPNSGEPEVLVKDNVVGIASDTDGAVVLFGLAHMSLAYGYALQVVRTPENAWRLTEVARLPDQADALAAIGPDLFAAWSDGRAVVFSAKQGILGMAVCEVR